MTTPKEPQEVSEKKIDEALPFNADELAEVRRWLSREYELFPRGESVSVRRKLIARLLASCPGPENARKLEAFERLEREIEDILNRIPSQYAVRVREGGGPENLAASLAVSIAKMREALR